MVIRESASLYRFGGLFTLIFAVFNLCTLFFSPCLPEILVPTTEALQRRRGSTTMSKLSPALKELINAPFSRPGPAKAPAGIGKLYERIATEAQSKNLGARPWIVLSVCFFPLLLLTVLWSTQQLTLFTGRCHIHPQLSRLPPRPPHRLLLPRLRLRLRLQDPRACPRRRAHPRGRSQVHLLQRHPTLHQLPGRLPRLAFPRRPARARDPGLADHHPRQPRAAPANGPRPVDLGLRPL